MSREPQTLTYRQVEYVRAIIKYQDEHGMPPTYTEIGKCLGISFSAAHKVCEKMRKRGYLKEATRYCPRQVVLTEKALKEIKRCNAV